MTLTPDAVKRGATRTTAISCVFPFQGKGRWPWRIGLIVDGVEVVWCYKSSRERDAELDDTVADMKRYTPGTA